MKGAQEELECWQERRETGNKGGDCGCQTAEVSSLLMPARHSQQQQAGPRRRLSRLRRVTPTSA